MSCSQIIGCGYYVPSNILPNAELAKMVETSNEWIVTRTGINERRIAKHSELTSDMAVKAANVALSKSKIQPEDLQLLITATISGDSILPPTSYYIAEKIGAKNAVILDAQAACSGFIYCLAIADSWIKSGKVKSALVIGVETLSRVTDWDDRNSCILFGDGAGAAVISVSDKPGILSIELGAIGSLADLIYIKAGGSAYPTSYETIKNKHHYMQVNGKEVFKNAVRVMDEATRSVIKSCGLTLDDISLIIPHQANIRIVEFAAQKLGIPQEKIFANLDKYGNTSSASIPIALAEANEQGRLKTGDKIVLVGFGAGFTQGAAVINWTL